MNIVRYMRRSLSAQLSAWVVGCVATLFVVALGIMFHYSRQAVKEEAMGKATQTLENTVQYIDNTLCTVEVAAENMKWVVEQHLDTPDSMFTLSAKILENNPNLNGCSIAFDPYYYKEKGRFFSAYSYNGENGIETEQEGTPLYEYYCMDWFLIPKLLDRPYWIEPFKEEDTGGILVPDIITSYCMPIHDADGKSVGVLSVDIALKWLAQTILEAKPFPNSYCMLVGKGGSYLVHPDSTKLFYETVFTPTIEEPDTTLISMGHSMLEGKRGYTVLHDEEKGDSYVFYMPFKSTGWSVAIVCSENDIFEPYNQLQVLLVIITCVGLILLLVLTLAIIRHSLRPLRMLAARTTMIAQGDFDEAIPDSSRSDEIGFLQHSFSKMQRSIAEQISRMKHTHETLTRRGDELEKASQRAKEADRVKTAFVQNMTDRMIEPVTVVVATASAICAKRHPEEMRQNVDVMMANTEIITQLLDQLLEASKTCASTDEEAQRAEATASDNTKTSTP